MKKILVIIAATMMVLGGLSTANAASWSPTLKITRVYSSGSYSYVYALPEYSTYPTQSFYVYRFTLTDNELRNQASDAAVNGRTVQIYCPGTLDTTGTGYRYCRDSSGNVTTSTYVSTFLGY